MAAVKASRPLCAPCCPKGVALAACGGTAAAPASAPGKPVIAAKSQLLGDAGQGGIPEVGQVAPDFQYTTPDGATHKLSDLRGKKVLLNFWATWCAPCRSEMPDIQKALDESGDAVAVLGVAHFVWLVKKDLREPLIYAAVFALLFALRIAGWLQEARRRARDAKSASPLAMRRKAF